MKENVVKMGDRVRCSRMCEIPHRTDSIGIVTSVANLPWPIIVEWLDGTSSCYDEVELEVYE